MMAEISPRFFTTSLLPVYERLVLKGGRWRKIKLRVRVGYFHHPALGHSLIDTGYFNNDTLRGIVTSPFLSIYRALLRPSTLGHDPLSCSLALLRITRQEVQTLLISHFHADHIGRLRDFPNARIICSRRAWETYRLRSSFKNALSGVFGVLLPEDIETRLSFFEDAPMVEAPYELGRSYNLLNDGSLLVVDLPGHAEGHVGFCFPQLPKPFLYATDSQWLTQAIVEDRMPRFAASLVACDREMLRLSTEKVAIFVRRGGDVLLCHDINSHRYDLDAEGEAQT